MKKYFTLYMLMWSAFAVCAQAKSLEEGFEPLFNGKNLDGFYLKIKSDDQQLAKKVFAVENQAIHIFNEDFPQNHGVNSEQYDTHGMMYTQKKYSKYILRFEYKWGDKIANNFNQWQYDAGLYYHVVDDKIWPTGFEYQIRYHHETKRNHTGDLIRPKGTDYLWVTDAEQKEFLPLNKGGKAREVTGWMHLAADTKNFNALNDKWNICEVIVMGGEYVIHKLNGDIVNIATNLTPDAGIIGFQSETAEIFYRNIRIKQFEKSVPMETFLK